MWVCACKTGRGLPSHPPCINKITFCCYVYWNECYFCCGSVGFSHFSQKSEVKTAANGEGKERVHEHISSNPNPNLSCYIYIREHLNICMCILLHIYVYMCVWFLYFVRPVHRPLYLHWTPWGHIGPMLDRLAGSHLDYGWLLLPPGCQSD